MARPRLVVLIDNEALPEEDARGLWERFSQYMDEHPGDFAGFAAAEGVVTVKPEHRKGQAVLVVTSHGEAQQP